MFCCVLLWFSIDQFYPYSPGLFHWYWVNIENNVCMYSSYELFQRSREGYFGVYFPSCEAAREISTKITLELMQKQFVMRVHTLFYFLRDITNP